MSFVLLLLYSLIFEAPYSFRDGLRLVERLRNSGATAAFISDDELAVGILDGLLDAGVKVPEEFEIITSNNSLLTDVVRPKLNLHYRLFLLLLKLVYNHLNEHVH